MSNMRKKYVQYIWRVPCSRLKIIFHVCSHRDDEEIEDSFIVFCHFAFIHTHTIASARLFVAPSQALCVLFVRDTTIAAGTTTKYDWIEERKSCKGKHRKKTNFFRMKRKNASTSNKREEIERKWQRCCCSNSGNRSRINAHTIKLIRLKTTTVASAAAVLMDTARKYQILCNFLCLLLFLMKFVCLLRKWMK